MGRRRSKTGKQCLCVCARFDVKYVKGVWDCVVGFLHVCVCEFVVVMCEDVSYAPTCCLDLSVFDFNVFVVKYILCCAVFRI